MQAVEKLETKSLPQQWCMLTVRPGKEQNARDGFHRYGVQAYWPNYYSFFRPTLPLRERRRRSVIPGYLFVPALPTEMLWDIAQRIPGVGNAVLNFSGKVATLQSSDIEVIRDIFGDYFAGMPSSPSINLKRTLRVSSVR